MSARTIPGSRAVRTWADTWGLRDTGSPQQTGERSLRMDVSELMKAFLARTHRAITIAQRMAIGTLVMDARIIDATPEAATWYGMAEPQCLIGSWISLLHHPDDAKL